ncbi:MAG: diguanylate cyclase [Lautropia sp.]|nr:diguanylate cyclase [Lautropia sp.]
MSAVLSPNPMPKRSMRQWLIPLGVLLLLAALWAGMFAHLKREETALLAATHDRARLLVDALAQHVRTSIHDIDVIARAVKREFEREPDAFDLRRLRGSGLLSPLSAAQVSVVNAGGEIVQSSIPYAGGVKVGDRAHFQVHVKPDVQGLHIGKPVLGRVSGIWTIQLTRRLEDKAGHFAGIVVVSEDRQHLIDPFLKAAGLHPEDTAVVSLKDGTVLSDSVGGANSPVQELALSPGGGPTGASSDESPRESSSHSQIAQANTGLAARDQERTLPDQFPAHAPIPLSALITAKRAVPDYPLLVEVRLDRAAALASFHQTRRVYWLLAGLMSLALLAFFVAIDILIRRLSNSEARFRVLSETDSLTGLANRHGLLAELEGRLAQQGATDRLALIYIDLGNLKQVNDELGHEAGDQLLNLLGQRLRRSLPEQVWSRFGGDEFIVIVPLADPSMPVETSLAGVRSQVLGVLRSPVNLRGHVFQMKAAVGVAVHEGRGSVASLIREANEAMYEAKAEMRQTGQTVWRMYTAGMKEASALLIEMAQRLRAGALPAVSWTPMYQLGGCMPWGYRVQPRWPGFEACQGDHAWQGALSASTASGLAPLMLAAWLQALTGALEGCDVDGMICLPLSAAQCQDAHCLAIIEGWCADTACPVRRVYFECPASWLDSDSAQRAHHLKRLLDTGAAVLMGDFQGGFSALAWLETGQLAGVSVSGQQRGLARQALAQLAADGFLILAGEAHAADEA